MKSLYSFPLGSVQVLHRFARKNFRFAHILYHYLDHEKMFVPPPAKFHEMGQYDQLCCKPCYKELCDNNITSNLEVMPCLSLIENLPPTIKMFLYERHQWFFLSVWMCRQMFIIESEISVNVWAKKSYPFLTGRVWG